jgi:hypothetical protein
MLEDLLKSAQIGSALFAAIKSLLELSDDATFGDFYIRVRCRGVVKPDARPKIKKLPHLVTPKPFSANIVGYIIPRSSAS